MKYKNKSGFTLIEVLIYITLSSLLLTGVIVSTYSLIDGNKWLLKRTVAFQEGHFVLQKINWLMRNQISNKNPEAFEIYLDEGQIWLQYSSQEKTALTSDYVTVDSFIFEDGDLEFSIEGIAFKKKYE
ncbi:MAG: prepilin-type N-terminal cleavage/methylation domain-containing protein [Candidatus Paceibacterota bacterium]